MNWNFLGKAIVVAAIWFGIGIVVGIWRVAPEIIARHLRRLRPLKRVMDAEQPSTERFLAVGLNHFARPGNDLNGCIPDDHTMQGFATYFGINPDDLEDKAAVKTAALGWLSKVQAEALANKVFYVGFSWSGHGTHYPRPEEPDGLGEALVCYDIREKGGDWDPDTIIKDTELRDILNGFPATCIVELFLDTCYSGGMDRGMILQPHQQPPFTGRYLHNPGNSQRAMRMANSAMSHGLNSNIIMWCASSEAQESEDAYIAGGSHGAFTWYWNEAWKANPGASRVDLLTKTRDALRANGYTQVPRLKCWNAQAQAKAGPAGGRMTT